MNIERLEELAAVLESGELPGGRAFDMRNWDCGTAACIGGVTDLLFYNGPRPDLPWKMTAALLGLDKNQGSRLFFSMGKATHRDGAQAVRNLIADPDGDPWRHLRKEVVS